MLILYLFTPSDMNFDAQSNFGKKIVREVLVPWNHSYFKHALKNLQSIPNR